MNEVMITGNAVFTIETCLPEVRWARVGYAFAVPVLQQAWNVTTFRDNTEYTQVEWREVPTVDA